MLDEKHLTCDSLQGCLLWHEQGLFHSPLKAGAPLYRKSPFVPWPVDTSLVFCYANAVVSGPQHLDADCNCVELLRIPAHCHYEDAFMAQLTSFELPKAPAEKLRQESEQESRIRWQSLPDVIRNNQFWWG